MGCPSVTAAGGGQEPRRRLGGPREERVRVKPARMAARFIRWQRERGSARRVSSGLLLEPTTTQACSPSCLASSLTSHHAPAQSAVLLPPLFLVHLNGIRGTAVNRSLANDLPTDYSNLRTRGLDTDSREHDEWLDM